MAQALPIVFTELLNLTAAPLGISGDAVKFGSCTLESDKYITCCEQGQVAIVDLSAGNALTRQTMSAEAAIMNPVSKILALKCASSVHTRSLLVPILIGLILTLPPPHTHLPHPFPTPHSQPGSSCKSSTWSSAAR